MSDFVPGQIIERREVLHGEVWLSCPVTVVADDGERLAVRLDPGAPFTFTEHPFGVHPWAGQPAWAGAVVLQLHRAGDLYSVWKFFEPGGKFSHWYVNFESPIRRGPAHVSTDDYGLDLVVAPDGARRWKDVSDLHHQRVEGRISAQTVLDVLASAAQVEALLERDEHWWAAWEGWSPLIAAHRAPWPSAHDEGANG